LVLLLSGLLSGCSYNQATGGSQFNIVSEKEEIKIGRESDKVIRAEYGVYRNKKLQQYVNNIGQRLAKNSGRSNIPYYFTVLDSPVINAFALPGGYVYVTRGVVVQMNSEAELAFVLAHEVSHVAAKHGAQRLSQARSVGTAVLAAQLIFGSDAVSSLDDLINTGVKLAVSGYGRGNEFEADLLGLGYAYKSEYDPRTASNFLHTLKKQEKYKSNWLENLDASHPPTTERISRAEAKSSQLISENQPDLSRYVVGKAVFLNHINGIFMGETPQIGYVREEEYLNDHYGVAFKVPGNWQMAPADKENGVINVILSNGSVGVLERYELETQETLESFAKRYEKPNRYNRVSMIEKYRLFLRQISDQSVAYYFLRDHQGFVLSFEEGYEQHTALIEDIAKSWRFLPLDDHLVIHEVKPKETLVSIATLYSEDTNFLDRILSFNNLKKEEVVSVGQLVKIP
jgi:predicted Zn-dependent protease